MLSLPSDLQLEIIRFLDPRDVVHFQLTCRYFSHLIEEAGTMIWRECLQRHCEQNQLFSPSYGDLATVSEYKHAVTAPMRFTKSHDHATLSPGTCMTSTITKVQLDRDDFDFERDGWAAWVDTQIRDIYLIQGGRFILVWSNTSYEIWDLHDSVAAPKLVFSRTMGPEPIRGDYVCFKDLCSLPTAPSFSVLHDQVYSFVGHDVVSPDLCQPLVGARSMIYDIRCHQGGDPGPYGHQDGLPHLHRYRFILNPDEPTQSTLKLSQVLKCAYPDFNDMHLSSFIGYHQRCNGRLGVAWDGRLALSKPDPLVNTDTDTDLLKGSLQFLPFHGEQRMSSVSFCPASSRAVVHFKEIGDSGSLLTRLVLYEFL